MMKKLFNEFNLSWRFLLLFSVTIGLIVGSFAQIPLFNNTSFNDIAVYLDMWIIIAIFIINNTHSIKEAILKCFVFFLISQPMIYLTEVLIQVVIYHKDILPLLSLYFKNYYIGAGWLYWTLLTIPGSFIAYQIKKDNVLSAFILTCATGFLIYTGINGILTCLFDKTIRHLLNAVICMYFSLKLGFLIFNKRKIKILSLIMTSCIGIASLVFIIFNNFKPCESMQNIDFGNDLVMIDYHIDNPDIAEVMISEDGLSMHVNSKNIGNTKIVFYDKDNKEYWYLINVTSKNMTIEETNEK